MKLEDFQGRWYSVTCRTVNDYHRWSSSSGSHYNCSPWEPIEGKVQSVRGQWRTQKFWKGGKRQFISSVLIYRKCAQRNICLLHVKSYFLTKIWANRVGGAPPPLNPPLSEAGRFWSVLTFRVASWCGVYGVGDASQVDEECRHLQRKWGSGV